MRRAGLASTRERLAQAQPRVNLSATFADRYGCYRLRKISHESMRHDVAVTSLRVA